MGKNNFRSFTFRSHLYCFFFLFNVIAVSFSQPYSSDEYGILNANYALSGLGSSSNFVNIPHHADFDLVTQGTIEMWVNPASYTTTAAVISKGSTANQSFLLGIDQNSYTMFLRIGSTVYANNNGSAVSLNQWSHIAVTWANGPNFTVTFFINGNQSGTPITANAVWNINTDPVRIGASQFYTSQFFNGKIDEVRIWSIARIAAQISDTRFIGLGDAAFANNNSALTSSSAFAGLISSWNFNFYITAYDDVSQHHGIFYGSATCQIQDAGAPIPYNFVLRLPGGTNDYLTIPTSNSFNQNSDGTFELWYKPLSFSNDAALLSKGNMVSSLSFVFGVTTGGKLLFRTGSNPVASNGVSLTLNKWNHCAAAWHISGSNFIITFYLNGVQNGTTVQIPNSFPFNGDPLLIGNCNALSNMRVNGWIDEVRIWNPELTAAQIETNMYVSGRALLPNTALLGFWNFDGNVNNLSAVTGIDASFNTGGTNNGKISGYINENLPGVFPAGLASHITVINRGGTPNSFPSGFYMKNVYKPIPDNNVTGIFDSIIISNMSGIVNSIEVFVCAEHGYAGDLIVSVISPNGTIKNLVNRNGGSYDNILSFFSDAFSVSPTNSMPPWALVKSIDAMGNFNNTNINGTWIIKCVDAAGNDAGVLKGWGLRINNTVVVGNSNPAVSLPQKFLLSQNYPNPFNPVTGFNYEIPIDANVIIVLYDMLGRNVKTLVNDFKKAGSYNVELDASDLSSGTYFYKIEVRHDGSLTGGFTDVKKMVLIK